MGADMLVYSMWIREDKKPDWDKAKAAAKELRWAEGGTELPEHAIGGIVYSALEGEYDDGPEAEAKFQEHIAEHLEIVKDAIDGYNTDDYNRELGATSFAGWMVYITGGLSNGDSPTDLADSVAAVDQLGLLEAAGFFDDSNAVEIRP